MGLLGRGDDNLGGGIAGFGDGEGGDEGRGGAELCALLTQVSADTRNPKPEILHLKPFTPKLSFETLHSKPYTRKPMHETLHPKPYT